MGFFLIPAILVFIIAAASNIFISVSVFKYKKRYFVRLKLGVFSSFPLVNLCMVLKIRNGVNVLRVGKNGRLKKLTGGNSPKIKRAFISEIIRSIRIITLNADLRIGLDEAKNTAILCGAAASALDFLMRKFVHDKKNSRCRVTPVYDSAVFSIEFRCIFKLNMAKGIIIYLIKEIKRRCRKNESYTGSYADNDE